MDGEFTVFDTLDRVAVGDIRTRLRDILGAFLFRGEDVDKRVKVLSGGERSRLAMARLMLEPYNLLILDEPTNHMDMLSKDILKQALIKYDGTVIVISHDREFLDSLVDTVYEFRDGKVKEHLGGIYDFLRTRKIENLKEIEAVNKPSMQGKDGAAEGAAVGGNSSAGSSLSPKSGPKSGPNASHVSTATQSSDNAHNNKQNQQQGKPQPTLTYAQKKEQDRQRTKLRNSLQKTEDQIQELENTIKELDALLIDPTTYNNELFNKYNATKLTLESKMETWEQIQIELENN